jgi:hypothetical protein
MKIAEKNFKAIMSVAVAAALTSFFTLRTLAAPEITAAAPAPIVAQDCTGTLTVAEGTVTINGNSAQTGATVMSNSTISTSSGGRAVIDLGQLGRVELEGGTTATILCVGNTIVARPGCDVEVEVSQGQVTGDNKTVTAGEEEDFDTGTELTAPAGSVFSLDCEDDAAGAFWIGPGVWGVIALIGVGAGIITGIAIGDEDGEEVSDPTP